MQRIPTNRPHFVQTRLKSPKDENLTPHQQIEKHLIRRVFLPATSNLFCKVFSDFRISQTKAFAKGAFERNSKHLLQLPIHSIPFFYCKNVILKNLTQLKNLKIIDRNYGLMLSHIRAITKGLDLFHRLERLSLENLKSIQSLESLRKLKSLKQLKIIVKAEILIRNPNLLKHLTNLKTLDVTIHQPSKLSKQESIALLEFFKHLSQLKALQSLRLDMNEFNSSDAILNPKTILREISKLNLDFFFGKLLLQKEITLGVEHIEEILGQFEVVAFMNSKEKQFPWRDHHKKERNKILFLSFQDNFCFELPLILEHCQNLKTLFFDLKFLLKMPSTLRFHKDLKHFVLDLGDFDSPQVKKTDFFKLLTLYFSNIESLESFTANLYQLSDQNVNNFKDLTLSPCFRNLKSFEVFFAISCSVPSLIYFLENLSNLKSLENLDITLREKEPLVMKNIEASLNGLPKLKRLRVIQPSLSLFGSEVPGERTLNIPLEDLPELQDFTLDLCGYLSAELANKFLENIKQKRWKKLFILNSCLMKANPLELYKIVEELGNDLDLELQVHGPHKKYSKAPGKKLVIENVLAEVKKTKNFSFFG